MKATVLVVAACALVACNRQGGVARYKEVREVHGNLRGKLLQVHGVVACKPFKRERSTMSYRFEISTSASSEDGITARYSGDVPDPFMPGAEVIAEGTLDDHMVLDVVKDGIMAKRGKGIERCAALKRLEMEDQ